MVSVEHSVCIDFNETVREDMRLVLASEHSFCMGDTVVIKVTGFVVVLDVDATASEDMGLVVASEAFSVCMGDTAVTEVALDADGLVSLVGCWTSSAFLIDTSEACLGSLCTDAVPADVAVFWFQTPTL